MNLSASWLELLSAPSPGQHIAQLYTQREFLSRAIATFVGDGLRRGDAAVVISTPLHWRASLERLQADGLNVQNFQRRGQLLVRDARNTLATFMVDGTPDRDRFRATIEGAIDETRAAGVARIPSRSRRNRFASVSMVAPSNRSVLYSKVRINPGPDSWTPSVRSNCEPWVGRASGSYSSPPMRPSTPSSPNRIAAESVASERAECSNDSMAWNTGERVGSRGGARRSTNRGKGKS